MSSSSNSSLHTFLNVCSNSHIGLTVFSAMFVTNLLIFPVFILVFYLGYQQWRRQRASSPAAASHSNLFTYHAIAMQLNEVLGLFLFFCGSYNNLPIISLVGLGFLSLTSAGLAVFHILICLEHYLAVVHPVTYLHLKRKGEVLIRHVCTGCVWILSFGWLVVFLVGSNDLNFVLYLCCVVFTLSIISFCSFSVLCALKRSGPGNVFGNKKQVDQSKQTAFYTILVIMALLLFRLVVNVTGSAVRSNLVDSDDVCVAFLSIFWLDLPSSLVLPLLFLHRAGKLKHCRKDTESG